MLRSFRHKGLAELWRSGKSAKVDAKLHQRIIVRLTAIDSAALAKEIDVPGYDFHPLHGFRPIRYSIHINGPWCITFEFSEGDAERVDLEQYH